MTTPNELRVLRTTVELGAVTKRKVSSKMGINTEYAGYLLEALSKRDFLSPVSPGKFELTKKGADALLFQLHHVKGILEAKAYGTVRQIDKVNERISDYEDHVMRRTMKEFRSGQKM
ncbi:MAG: hypothetical protein ABIN18_27320 [Pseudomonadota bacterium]